MNKHYPCSIVNKDDFSKKFDYSEKFHMLWGCDGVTSLQVAEIASGIDLLSPDQLKAVAKVLNKIAKGKK